MSDQQQQPDPWATVREEWIEDAGGGRMMQYATDVDDARAEIERRHADELKAKDDENERLRAQLAAAHGTLRGIAEMAKEGSAIWSVAMANIPADGGKPLTLKEPKA